MNDEEFLNYCVSHCETPRAGFVREHVERLHTLAGKSAPDGLRDGLVYEMRRSDVLQLVMAARGRLAEMKKDTLTTDETTGLIDRLANQYVGDVMEREKFRRELLDALLTPRTEDDNYAELASELRFSAIAYGSTKDFHAAEAIESLRDEVKRLTAALAESEEAAARKAHEEVHAEMTRLRTALRDVSAMARMGAESFAVSDEARRAFEVIQGEVDAALAGSGQERAND